MTGSCGIFFLSNKLSHQFFSYESFCPVLDKQLSDFMPKQTYTEGFKQKKATEPLQVVLQLLFTETDRVRGVKTKEKHFHQLH